MNFQIQAHFTLNSLQDNQNCSSVAANYNCFDVISLFFLGSCILDFRFRLTLLKQLAR